MHVACVQTMTWCAVPTHDLLAGTYILVVVADVLIPGKSVAIAAVHGATKTRPSLAFAGSVLAAAAAAAAAAAFLVPIALVTWS